MAGTNNEAVDDLMLANPAQGDEPSSTIDLDAARILPESSPMPVSARMCGCARTVGSASSRFAAYSVGSGLTSGRPPPSVMITLLFGELDSSR